MNLGGSLVVLVASDAGLLCTVILLDGNFVRGVNSRGLNADLVRASSFLDVLLRRFRRRTLLNGSELRAAVMSLGYQAELEGHAQGHPAWR
ncbi:hypothetical protein [Bradyrhizobium sp. CCGB20]|uniref:hypothetical protein n=1 Tax=Bradyrhizobium sp. CCGB20 TaxID=2949633 RepID=UPI0020B36404|nr:hypothetical protein [Bradyrhizobium sp. CCGB20]MCP3397053.1 hypothetical protein [Bradyrhizobium sp. CCGB20]